MCLQNCYSNQLQAQNCMCKNGRKIKKLLKNKNKDAETGSGHLMLPDIVQIILNKTHICTGSTLLA